MTSETSERNGCAYGRETRAILRGIEKQFTTITGMLKQMVGNEFKHIRTDVEKAAEEMKEIRAELSQTKKDSRRTLYLVLVTIIAELVALVMMLAPQKLVGG